MFHSQKIILRFHVIMLPLTNLETVDCKVVPE